MITIQLKKELTREMLENIFVGALEGGSNYWYFINDRSYKKIRRVIPQKKNPYFSLAMAEAVLDHGMRVNIDDVETGERLGVITKSTIRARLKKMIEDGNYRFIERVVNENADAGDYDVVFQYLTMGKLVFG